MSSFLLSSFITRVTVSCITISHQPPTAAFGGRLPGCGWQTLYASSSFSSSPKTSMPNTLESAAALLSASARTCGLGLTLIQLRKLPCKTAPSLINSGRQLPAELVEYIDQASEALLELRIGFRRPLASSRRDMRRKLYPSSRRRSKEDMSFCR